MATDPGMLQSWYADYQADKGPTTANAQATGGAAPASAAGGMLATDGAGTTWAYCRTP